MNYLQTLKITDAADGILEAALRKLEELRSQINAPNDRVSESDRVLLHAHVGKALNDVRYARESVCFISSVTTKILNKNSDRLVTYVNPSSPSLSEQYAHVR